MNWQKAAGFALDVLFPRRCAFCGKVQGFAAECSCKEKVQKIRLPATALEPGGRAGCLAPVTMAYACFDYQPPVSESYHRLKFEGESWLARPMGAEMAKVFAACGLAEKVDCLVPVPVSDETMRERGYNHSALLARQLAADTGLLCLEDVLVKTKETRRQMDLTRQERQENIKGAYAVQNPQALRGKQVLLVDDVLTTGSTLGECARTMLAAGAQSCLALTLMAVEERGEAGE